MNIEHLVRMNGWKPVNRIWEEKNQKIRKRLRPRRTWMSRSKDWQQTGESGRSWIIAEKEDTCLHHCCGKNS